MNCFFILTLFDYFSKFYRRKKRDYTINMMNHYPEKKSPKSKSKLERLALSATHHIGSPISLIIHSFFFVGIFSLQWIGFSFDQIMLLLTTVVSLEAIYLAILIQLTVNQQAHTLAEVSEDVEDISKDIDDIQEDVEDIGEEMEKDDQALTLKHTREQEKVLHIEDILKELLQEVRELKDKHK